MFSNQSTATPLTLMHHASEAMIAGRWAEVTGLFVRAAEKILVEEAPDHRLLLLVTVADWEASGKSFGEMHAALELELGTVDPYLLGELWAHVTTLAACAGDLDLAAWMDDEIDATLTELLTTKDNHHV